MQRTGVKMDDSVFATKLLHAVRRLGENVRGTWAPVEQNVTSGRARCDTGYSCIYIHSCSIILGYNFISSLPSMWTDCDDFVTYLTYFLAS